MEKVFILLINILCFFRKNKKIKINKEIKKINIGSGINIAKGWINIDITPHELIAKLPRYIIKLIYKHFPLSITESISVDEYINTIKNNTFIMYNIKYGLPFADDSIDYVYTSHFLEHLYINDAQKLLNEIHRVLKKNGIVRITIPDLEYVFSLYKSGEKKKALSFLYSESKSNFTYHKYMYDFEIINNILTSLGFKEIKKCQYKEGKMPDINILDNRKSETLFVEAKK